MPWVEGDQWVHREVAGRVKKGIKKKGHKSVLRELQKHLIM